MQITGTTRWIVGGLLVAAAGIVTATVVARSGEREITIPAGTRLVGKLQETVSTEKSDAGDRVEIKTAQQTALYEDLALPAGASLHGEVTYAKGGGRISGAPQLTIRFTQLELEGRRYAVDAEPFRVKGKSDAKESALEIGGGAVAGGVIGAIAGDVVKGAVIGAVIGTGVALATPGGHIVLPAGQRLRVTLREPVTVRFKPEPVEHDTARASD
ncbi:MAG: hypothetical protein ACT4PM_13495 [Gemmatimonadales bacterium]